MLQVRELHGSTAPGVDEARGWIGNRVEDVYGAGIGRVEDILIGADGAPRWLLVREGRFTSNVAALPFDGALGSPGHVWVPHSKDAVKSSPRVPPSGQLTPEFERQLAEHYARAAAEFQATR